MAVKVLLVGAGGMGQAWARTLDKSDRCDLVAWVDTRLDAAAQAAQTLELSGIVCGVDLVSTADATKPDFVVDVTSPQAHREVTLQALGLGLPVLGEKPMAPTLEEARDMVAASQRSGKLYMVSQNRRYAPGIRALRSTIEGKLGTLGILNADFYIGAHFGGFRDEMESPLLLDMAIHTFDQARYLSGCDAVSVIAEEFNPEWSWYKGKASASVTFEMTGGLRFSYRGSWCAEGHPTSWDGDWRAVGSCGSAQWIRDGEVVVDLVSGNEGFHHSTERFVEPPASGLLGIDASLADFLDALESGEQPATVCHDNIKSLAMVFAAKASADSGTRVKVTW
jgi:predicted dehydrogenase